MFGEWIIYLAIYLILYTLSSFFSVFPTSLSSSLVFSPWYWHYQTPIKLLMKCSVTFLHLRLVWPLIDLNYFCPRLANNCCYLRCLPCLHQAMFHPPGEVISNNTFTLKSLIINKEPQTPQPSIRGPEQIIMIWRDLNLHAHFLYFGYSILEIKIYTKAQLIAYYPIMLSVSS